MFFTEYIIYYLLGLCYFTEYNIISAHVAECSSFHLILVIWLMLRTQSLQYLTLVMFFCYIKWIFGVDIFTEN